jgi:DNA-binding transcriptional MerR regulator
LKRELEGGALGFLLLHWKIPLLQVGEDVKRTHDLIRRTGVSRKALRVYEARGLVSPARHFCTGYGSWGRSDIERVHVIGLPQTLDLDLATIWRMLASGAAAWTEVLATQEAWLSKRLEATGDALARVRQARRAAAQAAIDAEALLST